MPDPSTTRLALYKSKSDGSENVSYPLDLGQNWDKVDAAAGFQVVTSSTRPSTPYSGKPIMQSDTAYSTYVSNGTTPASGSWIEIPNSSSTFANNLKIAAGKQINIGASTSSAPLAVLSTTTGVNVLSSRVTGDTTASRFFLNADGSMSWGPGGTTAADTTLYRAAVDTLRTDDSFVVGGALTVLGTMLTTYTPTVSGHGTATFTALTGQYMKIGKWVTVKIYLTINAAGSGSGTFLLGLPSIPDRAVRQHISGYANPIGSTAGNAAGVVLSSGSGAMLDQVRDAGNKTLTGADLAAGTIITLEGVYHE